MDKKSYKYSSTKCSNIMTIKKWPYHSFNHNRFHLFLPNLIPLHKLNTIYSLFPMDSPPFLIIIRKFFTKNQMKPANRVQCNEHNYLYQYCCSLSRLPESLCEYKHFTSSLTTQPLSDTYLPILTDYIACSIN